MEGYRAKVGTPLRRKAGRVWEGWKVKRYKGLQVTWALGHLGIIGNKDIDRDAKEVAEGWTSRPEDLPSFLRQHPLPLSKLAARQAIR